MEFKVYQKELELQSRGWIPTFHDISKEVMQIVKDSGVMGYATKDVNNDGVDELVFMTKSCLHRIGKQSLA